MLKGYLWANVETAEDIQKAIDYYNLQVENGEKAPIQEIRMATKLEEAALSLESSYKTIFDREVPSGHIFFVIGEPVTGRERRADEQGSSLESTWD